MQAINVVNEDILDEQEPIIYVQRYHYPARVYQVQRKATGEDAPFTLPEGAKRSIWGVINYFSEEPDPEDEMPTVFAVIYLDEENPPATRESDLAVAEPYCNIVFDSEIQQYRAEACYKGYEALDSVTTPTLQTTIQQALEILDPLVTAEKAQEARKFNGMEA